MDINKFTEKSREALAAAQSLASELKHQQLDVEHFIYALLQQEPSLVARIIDRCDTKSAEFTTALKQVLDSRPKLANPSEVYFSSRISPFMSKAEKEAKKLDDTYLSAEHFLLASTHENNNTNWKHRKRFVFCH